MMLQDSESQSCCTLLDSWVVGRGISSWFKQYFLFNIDACCYSVLRRITVPKLNIFRSITAPYINVCVCVYICMYECMNDLVHI